jgi:hypothetical protein
MYIRSKISDILFFVKINPVEKCGIGTKPYLEGLWRSPLNWMPKVQGESRNSQAKGQRYY